MRKKTPKPLSLKEIRKSWNMNQTQFGAAIGKSIRSVQDYELGITPVPEAVEKLIDYMVKDREAQTANAS